MRLSPRLTIPAALAALLILGVVVAFLLQPPRPLIGTVTILPDVITPNGDGQDDAARISYTLNRNARISLRFKNKATGQTFTFRDDEPRGADKYDVLFGGIVPGFTQKDEQFTGQIQTRLVPNGDYEWSFAARTESGETSQKTGTLTVAATDTTLPLIQGFSVLPKVFSPNQDGIADRIAVNAYLTKKSDLSVFLLATDGTRYDMPERVEMRNPGDSGAHTFDYDGGADNNVTPPPDGAYTLVAEAQDAAGQRVRETAALTIKDSGLPQAEIQPQTSGAQVFYTTSPATSTPVPEPGGVLSTDAQLQLNQNGLLIFRLTVSNYGKTPIRTLAPFPGTVYGWNDLYTGKVDPVISHSGVWFVGLQCETSKSSFPYRWAIGSPDALTKVTSDAGETFYYLLPGQKASVWGAVQMSEIVLSRNPQECWTGLIHEDNAIGNLQGHIGPIKVQLIAAP